MTREEFARWLDGAMIEDALRIYDVNELPPIRPANPDLEHCADGLREAKKGAS